jgi:hypothetical protein
MNKRIQYVWDGGVKEDQRREEVIWAQETTLPPKAKHARLKK